MSHVIETSFDPELAAMAVLPVYRPTRTCMLTNIFLNFVI